MKKKIKRKEKNIQKLFTDTFKCVFGDINKKEKEKSKSANRQTILFINHKKGVLFSFFVTYKKKQKNKKTKLKRNSRRVHDVLQKRPAYSI